MTMGEKNWEKKKTDLWKKGSLVIFHNWVWVAENEIAFFLFFSVQSETYAHSNYTFESAAAIDITSLWYSFHICISKIRWPCPYSLNWYRQELSFSLGMTENKGTYRYGLLSCSTEIWHSGENWILTLPSKADNCEWKDQGKSF